MVPSSRMTENEYWWYILREGVSGWLDGFVTRVLTAKEYSKTAKTPPGLRTRYAPLITSDTKVQFLIPKAMV